MITNEAKRRMLAGEPALGLTVVTGAPLSAKAMSLAGFDFVMVDNQHGNWGDDSNQAAFDAIAMGSAMPAARVCKNDFYAIGRLLDRGALGIIIPMVNTADDAREASRAVRYPPRGGRSFGPFGTSHMGEDYAERANDEVYLGVQIETTTALENAEEILSVEGVDGCWVGPADLGLSMGVDLSTEKGRSEHEKAIVRVLQACHRTGKIPGIAARPWTAKHYLDMGFLFVTVGSDLMLTNMACQDVLKRLRQD